MSAVLSGPGRILLVGGGNMGGALLRGWVDYGLAGSDLHVVDPEPSPALRSLAETGGLGSSVEVPSQPFDVAVLAVKPQSMAAALASLKPALRADTLVISVAAGKTIGFIEAHLGPMPVVRAMPNTPALIGRGIAGCFANPAVGEPLRAKAEALLSASGPVLWLASEADIDAVTAVSGSGPAYVFHLTEALAKAGEALGLLPDVAMTLARHTVAGAGELMIRSDEAPAALRRNVTSPHGTTEAALAVLMAPDGLEALMLKAVTAARDRASALARE